MEQRKSLRESSLRMRARSSWLLAGALFVLPAVSIAAEDLSVAQNSVDCELAERYSMLASQATEQYEMGKAISLLQRAAQSCGSYTNWISLAEAAAAEGDEKNAKTALAAYASAYSMADNNPAMAEAKLGYATTMFRHFDRGRAVDIAFEARNLAPENTMIAASAKDMLDQSTKLTGTDVKRGLGGFGFKPPPLKNKLDDLTDTGNPAGGSAITAVRAQVNFLVNSVELDELTKGNLGILAKHLGDPVFEGQKFRLIGHADSRGSSEANWVLSERRAQAVMQQIANLNPQLEGRLSAVGMGEKQLRSTGNTEDDHRANRRLEVMAVRE